MNNRFIWLIYSILIILFTTSCATRSNHIEQQDTNYIAPMIAVIKHRFSQDKYNKNEMVYIGFKGKSLPYKVQKEFNNSYLSIYSINIHETGFHTHNKPFFDILDIQIKDSINCEIVAHDFYDVFFAQIIRFYLKKQDEKWIVEDAVIEFVY